MGIHGVGGNLGLAVTPFLAAALAKAVGWRLTCAAIGAFSLLLAGVGMFTGAGKGQNKLGTRDTPKPPPDSRSPSPRAPLVLIFMMAVFNGMTYRGFTSFVPAYFAQSVRLSWLELDPAVMGGTMTTAILLLGVLGQFLGGNMADRLNKEMLYTAIFFTASVALLLLGKLGNLPLVIASSIFAFLYFMNQPVGNALITAHSQPRHRGLVFGLFFFMSFGAGSIMGYLAGKVGETFALKSIFALLAGCLLASGLLGLLLVRATRKKKENPDKTGRRGGNV
jgi:MFS family permease